MTPGSQWRRWLAVGASVLGLAVCALGVAGLWLWQLAWPLGGLTLNSLNLGGTAAAPCPGGQVLMPHGLGVESAVDGVVPDDLVAVLSALSKRGWLATTNMTASIELRPAEAAELNLGLMRVRLYRGVTLAYTVDRQTQVVAQTTVAVCGP